MVVEKLSKISKISIFYFAVSIWNIILKISILYQYINITSVAVHVCAIVDTLINIVTCQKCWSSVCPFIGACTLTRYLLINIIRLCHTTKVEENFDSDSVFVDQLFLLMPVDHIQLIVSLYQRKRRHSLNCMRSIVNKDGWSDTIQCIGVIFLVRFRIVE